MKALATSESITLYFISDLVRETPQEIRVYYNASSSPDANADQKSSTVVPNFRSRANRTRSPPVTKSINPSPTLL